MSDTIRTDKPVTRQEAQKVLKGSYIPGGATEVYYLFFAGGLQDLEYLLRFRIDPEQADAAIDGLIAANNKTMRTSLSYPKSALPPPQPAQPWNDDGDGRFKPVQWFQPQALRNGYFRQESAAFALKIWYDADNSIVYVYQND